LAFHIKQDEMSGKIRKAVFPVGGLGTRFLPATKAMPKEMLPVVDKPLIQWAVEEAQAAGIEEFYFVTGRGKAAIEDHFDRSYELEQTLEARGKTELSNKTIRLTESLGRIAYTRQPEPLGLGHAIWCARHLVGDEPFAVLLPDDLVLAEKPCLAQMVQSYGKAGGNMAAVMDVPKEHTNRYGILDIAGEDGPLVAVKGLVEKPDPSDAPSTLSIIGRYILQPEVFEHLERQKKGAGGEIQLTDAIADMIGSTAFHGLRFEGRRFDCGDKIGFLEANIAFAHEREDMKEAVKKICREFS